MKYLHENVNKHTKYIYYQIQKLNNKNFADNNVKMFTDGGLYYPMSSFKGGTYISNIKDKSDIGLEFLFPRIVTI